MRRLKIAFKQPLTAYLEKRERAMQAAVADNLRNEAERKKRKAEAQDRARATARTDGAAGGGVGEDGENKGVWRSGTNGWRESGERGKKGRRGGSE